MHHPKMEQHRNVHREIHAENKGESTVVVSFLRICLSVKNK